MDYEAKITTCSILIFQSGFRPARSTTTSLLDVYDNTKSVMDEVCVTVMVLFDYTQAFPSIIYEILFQKMPLFGFSNEVVKWFESFLWQRSHSVRVGGNQSSCLDINRGVTQGSPLSSILFSIYINDLPSIIKFCKYHLYADDLQIYIKCSSLEIQETIKKLNADITAIEHWAKDQGLQLNPGKTQLIILGNKVDISYIPTHKHIMLSVSY